MADIMDPLRGNGTMVYCVATNTVMATVAGVESNRTTVTIAGESQSIAHALVNVVVSHTMRSTSL